MSGRGIGRKDTDGRFEARLASPIGVIRVGGTSRGVSELEFVRGAEGPGEEAAPGPLWEALASQRTRARELRVPDVDAFGADVPEPVAACLRQLEAYFAGRLTRFDVALDLGGTPFQRRVWAALMAVPYGVTTTYGTIAASLGAPAAMRAVGGANHRNPVSIIVPCHRVLGASGGLTGYGGGLWRKAWLLAHEKKHAPR